MPRLREIWLKFCPFENNSLTLYHIINFFAELIVGEVFIFVLFFCFNYKINECFSIFSTFALLVYSIFRWWFNFTKFWWCKVTYYKMVTPYIYICPLITVFRVVRGCCFMVSVPRNDAFFYIFGAYFVKRNDFHEHKFYPYFRLKSGLCVIFPILRIA